ncbi:MAG: ABC transporter permease [Acidimicrobiales bacterium]
MTTASFTLPRGSKKQHFVRQMEITGHLVGQTFNAKYRRASLGVLWVWAEPFARMLVFVLVFEKALGIRAGGNQTVYLFVGILFIRAATQGLNMATTSPMTNQALVNLAGVDRRIFPVVSVCNAFVDLLLSIPIIFLLLLAQGLGIPMHTLALSIPIMVLYFFMILGAGYILAALNIRIRDITLLVQTATTMLFYLSPVFWGPENIEGTGFEWIIDVNPIAAILMSMRDVMAWGVLPDWGSLAYATVVTVGLMSLGWWLYGRARGTMADHL